MKAILFLVSSLASVLAAADTTSCEPTWVMPPITVTRREPNPTNIGAVETPVVGTYTGTKICTAPECTGKVAPGYAPGHSGVDTPTTLVSSASTTRSTSTPETSATFVTVNSATKVSAIQYFGAASLVACWMVLGA